MVCHVSSKYSFHSQLGEYIPLQLKEYYRSIGTREFPIFLPLSELSSWGNLYTPENISLCLTFTKFLLPIYKFLNITIKNILIAMLFNDFKSIQACIKYETQGNILFCYYYYMSPKTLSFCYRKTVWYFFKIIFTVGRYTWEEFASARSMLDRRHEGRGRATPIF